MKRKPILLYTLALFGLFSCTSDTQVTQVDTELAQQLRTIYAEQPLVDLVANYLEPYPNRLESMVSRGDSSLYYAMAAYESGDYETAIQLFPNYSHVPEQVGYIHLYKGIAELLTGRQYDSFKTFQRIPSRYQEAFEVSNWYLAMNQVVFNNKYFIKEKLGQVIEAGSYGADRAQLLLQDLEKMEAAQSSK